MQVGTTAGRATAVKVPEITMLFWVITVLTTGIGEAAADHLGAVSLVLAGAAGVLGLAAALWLLVDYIAVSRADVQRTPAGAPVPATEG
jgi:uncharacterized membrane-anchored protein